MIENLLLDAEAMWAVLEPHRELVQLRSEADVDQALRAIAEELVDDEIRLRVPTLARPVSARISAAREDEVPGAVNDARARLTERLDALEEGGLAAEFEEAKAAVVRIREGGRELEFFRGKTIFDEFYERHAKAINVSKKAFGYAVAREAVKRVRLQQLVAPAVMRIEEFIPSELPRLLEEATALELAVGAPDVGEAAEQVSTAYERWEAGIETGVDFEELRERLVGIARAVEAASSAQLAETLRIATAQLGVRSAV
jgi:hypothetical protein